MDRDIPSLEPLVYLIHVCLPESTKGALLQNGGKHKVTAHGTPSREKAYIQWGAASFPKGIINDTAISFLVPCSF